MGTAPRAVAAAPRRRCTAVRSLRRAAPPCRSLLPRCTALHHCISAQPAPAHAPMPEPIAPQPAGAGRAAELDPPKPTAPKPSIAAGRGTADPAPSGSLLARLMAPLVIVVGAVLRPTEAPDAREAPWPTKARASQSCPPTARPLPAAAHVVVHHHHPRSRPRRLQTLPGSSLIPAFRTRNRNCLRAGSRAGSRPVATRRGRIFGTSQQQPRSHWPHWPRVGSAWLCLASSGKPATPAAMVRPRLRRPPMLLAAAGCCRLLRADPLPSRKRHSRAFSLQSAAMGGPSNLGPSSPPTSQYVACAIAGGLPREPFTYCRPSAGEPHTRRACARLTLPFALPLAAIHSC
ncbi:hypothetical protein BS50DRAFT_666208 [Corynespora cassiicola Philippines]|uniref:Uncharacterized protein n=1 Tax=Corynespora cassiicola Philippines TaxID=1448308 RepID=A0A2T2NSM3_CORCC|nr:hypothetical protein BS50DRAFT_666208 [Corynespora cassiicola Philippines]